MAWQGDEVVVSHSFETAVRQADAAVGAVPGDWRRLRELAAAEFAPLGLPTRRLEAWRYTDLRDLSTFAFRLVEDADRAAAIDVLPMLVPADQRAARLVVVAGRFNPTLSDVARVPEGVTIGGARDHRLADGLGRLAVLEGQPLVALNTALAEDALVISVGRDVVVDKPIEVVFLAGTSEREVACHPRLVLHLEHNAQATVVEHHVGYGGARYLNNLVSEIAITRGAGLRHYKLQRDAGRSFHIATGFVEVGEHARYEAFGLTLGAAVSRNETTVTLASESAEVTLAAAYLSRDRQLCDHTSTIHHRAPRTRSRQVVKGVIDGQGRGVFQGRIVVDRVAQKTDGHQASKALLLSDGAEIDQKPALEIFADDVKCSHGATAGQLDRLALFYLRSRGLDAETARRMLIAAFLGEAFEEISDEEVRATLLEPVQAWFAREEDETA